MDGGLKVVSDIVNNIILDIKQETKKKETKQVRKQKVRRKKKEKIKRESKKERECKKERYIFHFCQQCTHPGLNFLFYKNLNFLFLRKQNVKLLDFFLNLTIPTISAISAIIT